MSFRRLIQASTVAAALLTSLPAVAETIRFGFLELDRNPAYDSKRTFFRTCRSPWDRPSSAPRWRCAKPAS